MFKTYFALLSDNGLFHFSYVTFYRDVTVINALFLANYTRYENKVQSFRKDNKVSFK